MLNGHATFDESEFGFNLQSLPSSVIESDSASIPLGRYELPRRSEEAHIYRIQHPLAQSLLKTAQKMQLTPAKLQLDYEAYGSKVSVLEPLKGKAGIATVELLTVQSLGATEEYLLAAGQADTGDLLDADIVEKLLTLPGRSEHIELTKGLPQQNSLSSDFAVYEQNTLDFASAYIPIPNAIKDEITKQKTKVIGNVEQRNLVLFTQESEKLDAWADDLKVGLEREIKELDRAIKESRTKSKGAATLAEKLEYQKEQRTLEASRDKKRRELFERQDEIQQRRDGLIDELEKQLEQKIANRTILSCEWELK
jgi:hypothetical protein